VAGDPAVLRAPLELVGHEPERGVGEPPRPGARLRAVRSHDDHPDEAEVDREVLRALPVRAGPVGHRPGIAEHVVVPERRHPLSRQAAQEVECQLVLGGPAALGRVADLEMERRRLQARQVATDRAHPHRRDPTRVKIAQAVDGARPVHRYGGSR
jgi:hypothetical protein